ncbi:MAG: STAS/SEC14 domain-containing protein [Myxococcales bacterium]|nr:STAS/SEC14 domain-containing protein [Myxococcales bacterium]
MKLRFQYEDRSGYLYARFEGRFEPTVVRDFLQGLAEEIRAKEMYRVLCDIRDVEGVEVGLIPLSSRFDLGEFAASILPKKTAFALLTDKGHIFSDRFGEDVMVNRGVNFRVFSELQDALSWLGVSHET